ncbi:MAG: hypothetical protein RR202_08005 [Bacteroidales bacterium]
MEKLKVIFKRIREDFKDQVPPLTATIDQEHHYEVWAINGDKKTFFGKVIMHADYVELSFYKDLSRETEWTLFPGDIFKRMEDRFSCDIPDLSPELQGNIKEVIGNLIDYFKMNGYLPK